MRRRVYIDTYTAHGPQHLDEYVQEQMKCKKEQELKIAILIGPSGSGKSCALKDAAERCGGRYHSVRGFLAGDWDAEKDALLFLDGLDEMRMGTEDWKKPLDEMLQRLRSFTSLVIISCRDRYWLSSDVPRIGEALKIEPKILEFAPLTHSEISNLLAETLGEDVIPSFLTWASRERIFHALQSPFLIEPLYRIWLRQRESFKGGNTMELLARECLREPTNQHREYQLAKDLSSESSDECLLSMAGRICFLLVFSGKNSIGHSPQSFNVDQLSSDDRMNFQKLRDTPLFTKTGFTYRVRWDFIASFLAARYLHGMIEGGEIRWNRAFGLFFRTKTVPRLWQECFFSFMTSSSYQQLRDLPTPKDPLTHLLTYESMGKSMRGWEVNLAYEKYGDVALRALGRLDSVHIMRFLEALGHEYGHTSMWLPSFLKELRYGHLNSALSNEWQKPVEHILFESAWSTEARLNAALCLAQLKQHDGTDRETAIKDIARQIAKGALDDNDAKLLGKIMLFCSCEWSLEEVMGLLQGACVKMVVRVFSGKHSSPLQHFLHKVFPSNEFKRRGLQGFTELLDHMSDILTQSASSRGKTENSMLKKVSPGILMELFGSWWKVAFEGSSSAQKASIFDAARISDYLCSLHIAQKNALSLRDDFIRKWLQENPSVLKDFLMIWLQEGSKMLKRYPALGDNGHISSMMFLAEFLLGMPQWPEDFGCWCLDQMLTRAQQESSDIGSQKDQVNWLSSKIAYCLHSSVYMGGGFSWQMVEEQLRPYEFFLKSVQEHAKLLEQREEGKRMLSHPQQRYSKPDYQKIQDSWRSTIRAERQLFQKNSASGGILSALGKLYLGLHTEVPGSCPQDRLHHFLGEPELISLAQQGLLGCLTRKGYPYEVADMIKLFKSRKISHTCYAILAGFEELVGKDWSDHHVLRQKSHHLTDESIQRVFISLLITRHSPKWLEELALCYPDSYRKMLLQYLKIRLKSHNSINSDLNLIRFKEKISEKSEEFWYRLAQAFPLNSSDQVSDLGTVLMHGLEGALAGPRYLDRWRLLIRKKLSYKTVRVQQKVLWMTASYLIDNQSDHLFSQFFKDSQQRREVLARFLASFLADNYKDSHRSYSGARQGPGPIENVFQGISSQKAGELFSMIAPYYPPYSQIHQESGSFTQETHEMRVAEFLMYILRSAIKENEVFEQLRDHDALGDWHAEIQRAWLRHDDPIGNQYLSEEDVIRFVTHKQPIHIQDLFCLVKDILRDQRDAIQGTDKHRDFWNMRGETKTPDIPRNEELCRDTLSRYLEGDLKKYGIRLIREHLVKDDGRVDLAFVLEGTDFYIPLELKKSHSKDLLSALPKQLIEKYTVDRQNTGGYGVYVVLYFGVAADKTLSYQRAHRKVEDHPQDLEQRLKAVLSEEQAEFIDVIVIDVSVASYDKLFDQPA